MSILDDAIREHLELKRAHGADDVELKKLEDEAFGPPARPDEPLDPFAEAPTEFLAAPDAGAEGPPEEEGRRAPNIADLQEAPHEPVPEPPAAEPAPQAEIDGGHSTEERHAIAEQPTEIFDVEGEFDDAQAASEAEAPSEEQLLDAELAEPRLAPVDPLAGIDGGAETEPEISDERGGDLEEDEDDDFFSEQRLSDELNQALETPLPGEPQAPATEEAEAIVEAPAPAQQPAEQDSGEFAEEEDSGEWVEEEESGEFDAEQDSGEFAADEGEDDDDESQEERTEVHPIAEQDKREAPKEDLLEDTPDFLEDAPEDDNLWFEQKPPKDFDFDD
jgi:hypothetical protein